MGIGRDLGLQLREWIHDGLELSGGPALTNRLMDALGAESSLRGPLRDLASQPLLQRALRLRGAEQQAALQALQHLLAETYSPRVQAELLDLLDAATGVATPRPEATAPGAGIPTRATAGVQPPPRSRPSTRGWRRLVRRRPAWEAELLAIAPGLLAGLIAALVLSWAAHELDRWTFARIGWSSGTGLAAVLLLLQGLSLTRRLRQRRRAWLLSLPGSGDPHRLWSWIRAAWLHERTVEGLLNGLTLLILLGPTPLGAGKLVLRYSLTTLACQAAAVLVARRFSLPRLWGGASAVIGTLTALATGLSLLQGREYAFSAGPLTIPAWVLMVVYGGLQLGWQLPRQGENDSSGPAVRLWASSWWWGTLAGLAWALITRAGELLEPLLRSGQVG